MVGISPFAMIVLGKLGHASEENLSSPCIIPSLENVRVQSISAGCEHSGVITEDGKLYTWGHGDGGRLGHGDNEPRTIPTLVAALEKMHTRYKVLYGVDLIDLEQINRRELWR